MSQASEWSESILLSAFNCERCAWPSGIGIPACIIVCIFVLQSPVPLLFIRIQFAEFKDLLTINLLIKGSFIGNLALMALSFWIVSKDCFSRSRSRTLRDSYSLYRFLVFAVTVLEK